MSAILATLYSSLGNLTVIQFVQNMRELNSMDDTLTIPAFKGNGRCSVWELGTVSFGLAKARTIPCRFYGGPPHNRAMYTGTLLTMFIDRLLTTALERNFNVIDKFVPAEIPDGPAMGWIG
ncbi:MAG: hypothetical protein WC315_00365 [Candidatus Omnitrophota bacterium]|jgi:hypothetical protein